MQRRVNMTVSIVAALLMCNMLTAGAENLEFGALIHPSRRYIVFTAINKGDVDLHCEFSVRAEYIDQDGNKIGFREVKLIKTVKSGDLNFQEEAGQRVIQLFSAQFSNPTISELGREEKLCDENIEARFGNYNYLGQMRNGVPNGQGTAKFDDGRTINGNFENGRPFGTITIEAPDGIRFEGEATGGAFRGKFTTADGERFEGEFNDKFDGKGTVYGKEGKAVGSFVRGKQSGYAAEYRNNGSIWKGIYNGGNIVRGGVTYLPNKLETTRSLLKVCNNKNVIVYVAIGFYGEGEWYSKGWFKIAPGECVKPNFWAEQNKNVYLSMHSDSWSWEPKDREKAGFCTDRKDRFVLTNKFCAHEYHEDLEMAVFGLIKWENRNQMQIFTINP